MRRNQTISISSFAVLGLVVALGVGGASGAGLAPSDVRPVAVSPGNASRLALTGDSCPTFSWGAVPGAASYELVVYRLGSDGEEAEPVLRQRISGSALSWTPSLERCLERGGRYAWSVRAAGENAASQWSAPSLFEVASGPSEAELEEALRIVQSYLGARGEAVPEGGSGAAEREASPTSESGELAGLPLPAAAAATELSVDGRVPSAQHHGAQQHRQRVPTPRASPPKPTPSASAARRSAPGRESRTAPSSTASGG